MKAASRPRRAEEVRILTVDAASGAMKVTPSAQVASLFEPGDLVIVNDAATLPASYAARTERGEAIELRLAGQADREGRRWTVAVLGDGDYRTKTEERPAPPALAVGERLLVSNLVFVVEAIRSERLIEVEVQGGSLAEIWAGLYVAGRPVQYAHVPERLALWDVQNVYAGRPWSVEMPSAGRALRVETLLELQRRGVSVARVTHAAGLSSIGDAVIDAVLPLPERYEVPDATWEAIARARERGGRAIAIGTSVVRALEGGARDGTRSGWTDLRIGRATRRVVVDAVLTGVHEADTSHFALLEAFAPRELLARALARAESEGLLGHEMGDACLVWGLPRVRREPAARETRSRARPRSPPGQVGRARVTCAARRPTLSGDEDRPRRRSPHR
jgi:S-adenosylmethionine:tRNA ribosyltransferase-isomerase